MAAAGSRVASGTGSSSEGGFECELWPGDALFVPSWWWHEVDTTPEPEHLEGAPLGGEVRGGQGGGDPWSLAVNIWFEPFFVKEGGYGCAGCPLRRNPADRTADSTANRTADSRDGGYAAPDRTE